MAWTPGRPAPPSPLPAPDATIWRVTRDVRAAEARVRTMPHGAELRIVVLRPGEDAELCWSCLYGAADSEEFRVASAGALADFQRFGWSLSPDAGTPQ